MASNKAVRVGPVAITTSVANIFNPPTLTGGTNPPATSTNSYYILRHIRVTNKTAGAVTLSAWIGATGGSAAGTEFLGNTLSIAANSYIDFYGALVLDAADFLTAQAGTATALTIEGEGEMGVR